MLTFQSGDTVTFRRGKQGPFQHFGTILRSVGRGCWEILSEGKRIKVNQRFIKRQFTPSVRLPPEQCVDGVPVSDEDASVPSSRGRYPVRDRRPTDFFY